MAASSNEFVDDVLRNWIAEFPSVFAYVVINQDGIPLKFSDSLNPKKAVQYAALVTDFLGTAKRSMRRLTNDPSGELQGIRIRTTDSTELIIVSNYFAHGKETAEFTLVAIQSCLPGGLPPYNTEKKDETAAEPVQ